MAVDGRGRKRERSWFVLTVVFVILTGAWIPLAAMSGDFAVWQLVISAYLTLNALLWWLYLRHERRKRETAAGDTVPGPTP